MRLLYDKAEAFFISFVGITLSAAVLVSGGVIFFIIMSVCTLFVSVFLLVGLKAANAFIQQVKEEQNRGISVLNYFLNGMKQPLSKSAELMPVFASRLIDVTYDSGNAANGISKSFMSIIKQTRLPRELFYSAVSCLRGGEVTELPLREKNRTALTLTAYEIRMFSECCTGLLWI